MARPEIPEVPGGRVRLSPVPRAEFDHRRGDAAADGSLCRIERRADRGVGEAIADTVLQTTGGEPSTARTRGAMEFADHQGLACWNGRDQAWEERATEHAAEIITWGIIDQRMRVDVRIDDTSCDQPAEAFRLLTGTEPTAGLDLNC